METNGGNDRDLEAGADEPLLSPKPTTEPVLPNTANPAPAPGIGGPNANDLVSVEPPQLNKEYVPIRREPIEGLDAKTIRRRLDRQPNNSIPEIHVIGSIKYGVKLVSDVSEGAFCRWKVSCGKAWQHLGGELLGQTQIGYPTHSIEDRILFEHPIDVHYACAGLQGWGALRIAIQCFRYDYHGRKVLSGYGFGHIPFTPGAHQVSVHIWRPLGNMEQEMRAFLLGETPSLVTPDAVYESAWKDRCRLITTSGGEITLEVFVMTRNWKEHSLQS